MCYSLGQGIIRLKVWALAADVPINGILLDKVLNAKVLIPDGVGGAPPRRGVGNEARQARPGLVW
ncbi:MAG TPA: hypothetical protein GXX47_03330 [Firmicutes bacterium]|nr:hypothetical protein [Bacillota bacterium]